MEGRQIAAVSVLAVSILVFCIGLGFVFWRYAWRSKRRTQRYYIFMGLLFLSVLLFETSYLVGTVESGSAGEVFRSVISGVATSLQFFTLDAQFGDVLELASVAFGGVGAYFYYCTACIFTLIVPLAGGYFVFNLLCSFAPRFNLFVKSYKRTKYVFSELNERSIVLAEDIAEQSWRLCHSRVRSEDDEDAWLKSMIIVFTDVYGGGSEGSSELIERAKKIGAVCLTDDVLERTLFFCRRKKKRVVYFLMDTEASDNLDAAVALLSEKRSVWKRTVTQVSERGGTLETRRLHRRTDRMSMYVFTQNEEANEIVRDALAYNCEKIVGKGGTIYRDVCDEGVEVKVVNEYRNLVYRLIDGKENAGGYPLYWHWLGGADKNKPLTVAVIGGGKIAREFFKAVAWCGLMLRGETSCEAIPVRMTFLAKNAKELGSSLAFDCPAIFEEMRADTTHFHADFEDATFGTEAFSDAFSKHGLDGADYVLVALGDDDLNLQVAGWVQRRLGGRCNPSPASIHFAIENDDLCKTLENRYLRQEKERANIVRMHPFSPLVECFRYANIRMTDLERRAMVADATYRKSGEFLTAKPIMQYYALSASIATALHFPYKLFGYGLLGETRFEDPVRFARGHGDSLGWIEHRRWCLYLYTQGYRCPSARKFVRMGFGAGMKFMARAHKDEKNRLHGCLVESGAYFRRVESVLAAYAEEIAKTECPQLRGAAEELRAGTDGAAANAIGLLTQTAAYGRLAAIVGYLRGDGSPEELAEAFLREERLRTGNAALSEAANEAIAALSDENLSLSALFRICFPPFDVEGNPVDDLERMSLFVTLFFEKPRPVEFKMYDVEIAEQLLRNEVQERVSRARNGNENLDLRRESRRLIDAAAEGGVWAWGEARSLGDAPAVKFLFVSSQEGSETLIVGSGCKTGAQATPLGGGLAIVDVPHEGSVCLGEVGGKYLHLCFVAKEQETRPITAEEWNRAAQGRTVTRTLCARLLPIAENLTPKKLRRYGEDRA